MIVEGLKANKPLMMRYPERRFFQTNEQSGTMVAIYSTLREDLYVVYAGQSPETQMPVIHAYLNPLVKFIWLGGAGLGLGALLALLPHPRPVPGFSGVAKPAAPPPFAHAPTPSLPPL